MNPGPAPPHPLLVKAYRVLLRLYPREVRREFGREMEELLADLYRSERQDRGRLGALRIVVLAFVEVPLKGSLAHWEAWQRARRERETEGRSFPVRLRGGAGGIGPTLDWLRDDLRQAVRRLAKAPALALVAVLSLAIGMGAPTALFSVINTLVLRGGSHAEPRGLVHVRTGSGPGESTAASSYTDLLVMRGLDDVFAEVGAFSGHLSRTREGGETRPIHVEGVTHNLLLMVGVQAAVGRTFLPEEDAIGAPTPVALLNWQYWHRRFGGDPSVVGRVVDIAGRPFTIVGVTPEGFRSFLAHDVRSDLLIPMSMMSWTREEGGREVYTDPGTTPGLRIIGQLQPGVALEQAQARLDGLSRQMRADQPDLYRGRSFTLAPISDVMVHPVVDEALVSYGLILLTAVGLVFLLACTNLMAFLLAQGVELREEHAIRLALGVRRSRLMMALLMEVALLSLLGAAGGLLLARWSLDLVAVTLPSIDISVIMAYGLISANPGLHRSLLLFCVGLAALAGAVACLVSTLRSTKDEVGRTLREGGVPGGMKGRWLQGSLVTIQVAISMVLLVSGGLFLRSLQAAQAMDPGFTTREAGVLWVDLQASGIPPSEWPAVTNQVLDRARSIPGIEAVGMSNSLPLSVGVWSEHFSIPGTTPAAEEETHWVVFTSVDPAFFDVMGISLLAGRSITRSDQVAAEPVVMVNEAAAQRFWPDEDPLGKEIRVVRSGRLHRVVGVVRDTKSESLEASEGSRFYFAYAQLPTANVRFVARGQPTPARIAASLRQEAQAMRPELVILRETTLEEQLSVLLLPARLAAGVLGFFGALALALASIGIYGAVSSAVSRRTREVVIRISLGAGAGDVVGTVIGAVMGRVLAGAVVGLAATFGLSRLLERFLVGIGPHDLITLVAVPVLLGVVALLGAWVPSRRAARMDPAEVLRSN